MGLLLIDLDNTLIDRTGAFDRWARGYLTDLGAPPADVAWLMAIERDGFEPRELVAEQLRSRYELKDSIESIVETLLFAHLAEIAPVPVVLEALDRAARAGWVAVVVTNGTVRQQEEKLRLTGLDRHVAGVVISERARLRKPDPRIFALAAEQAGEPLEGAWVIGDNPEADIGGACNARLASAWIRRGRVWPAADYAPTLTVETCVEAIERICRDGGVRLGFDAS